jgi:hypothetical protein
LTPLAKFSAAADKDPAAKKLATLLETSAQGKDHLSLSMQTTANGFRLRLELEEGVLKAIGSSIPMGGGPGMPPPPAGESPFDK